MPLFIGDPFFFNTYKKEALVDYLIQDTLFWEKYHLVLVSCYFRLDSAESLIFSLIKKITITKISIYIDRGSAINIGKDNILKWVEKISTDLRLEINFKIPKTSKLFHAKAYCLLSDDHNNGSLVLGSANLTNNGLINDFSNIEILYKVKSIVDIQTFYQELSNPFFKCINVEELENFSKEDDYENDYYYFKYALLQEGYFVQINDVTINNSLSIKYRFNEKARDESTNPILKDLGIEVQKSIYSANYFQEIENLIEEIFLKYNYSYKINLGNYGIKTAFGHWLPKNVVSYLNTENPQTLNDIELCKKEIKEALEKHLPTAIAEMRKTQDALLEKDWLTDEFKKELNSKSPESFLRDKIDNLLKNLDKHLLRYFIVKFNFNFTNPDEIDFFFQILKDSCMKSSKEIKSNNIALLDVVKEENIYKKLIQDTYIDESYAFLKLLFRTIESQDLTFIRCLDRNFLVDYVKRRQEDK